MIVHIAAWIFVLGFVYLVFLGFLEARDRAWRPPPPPPPKVLTKEQILALAKEAERQQEEREATARRLARTWAETDLSHIPSQRWQPPPPRCGKCDGPCRFVDAAKQLIECTRCGTKSLAKPG